MNFSEKWHLQIPPEPLLCLIKINKYFSVVGVNTGKQLSPIEVLAHFPQVRCRRIKA